jgi:prepilin-type N-terminal cleavage/methylation domain-containing protein
MKLIYPQPAKSRAAFTLVELLVVIAIIALLVSILLPALTRAKEEAVFLICKNQVRQFSMAITAYATENDEFVPPMDPFYGDTFNSQFDVIYENVKKGLGILYPNYIQDINFFACPRDTEKNGFKGVVEKLEEQGHEIITLPIYQNTPTSYLYFGGLTQDSAPHLFPKPGSRIKITDDPQYGPLLFERIHYDSYLQETSSWHINGRVNVLSLRCDVAEVKVFPEMGLWNYILQMDFVEEELRLHY